MILWINGAFGSGKTQAAYGLRRRVENAYVYDPENAGYFIRRNLPPSLCAGDFQDYPMWRAINLDMLRYMAERCPGLIIVPMTITSRRYYEELVGALSREHELRHVILCATRETLLRRLASRLEGRRSWAARQIDRCIEAFDGEIPGDRLYTDGMNPDQVVEAIAALAGVPLPEERRSALRRWAGRRITQLRHIR